MMRYNSAVNFYPERARGYHQAHCDNCAREIKRRFFFKTAYILYTFCSKSCRDFYTKGKGLC